MKTGRFKNRLQAGALLAQRLMAYAGRDDVIVLGLPRGGVPVGFAIAEKLKVPLDILGVRKIGVPGHEEFAMGAIATGGRCLLQAKVVRALEIPEAVVEALAQRELQVLEQREKLYRGERPVPHLRERVVILADDGLASGATMGIAAHVVREQLPARLIVAVPVGAPETCQKIGAEVDEIICLQTPGHFYAVGMWYDDFEPTSDDEVTTLLAKNWQQDWQPKTVQAGPPRFKKMTVARRDESNGAGLQ